MDTAIQGAQKSVTLSHGAHGIYESPPTGGSIQPEFPHFGSCDASEGPAEALPRPDAAPGLKAALDKLEKPCSRPSEAEQREGMETMKKRARAKYLTRGLREELEELDSPIPYERARGCCRVVQQEDGDLQCSYCRCRWCIVCNRIRMGTILNEYLPILRLWEDEKGTFFVTLTAPNVEAEALRSRVKEMKKRLRYCRRSIRETRGMDYRAVENWEVTFNGDTGTFHPHVHIAVRGKAQALALRGEWLKRWPKAHEAAQDVRKWDGSKGGMKELAKYATKMIAPGEDKDRPPAEALDVIFRALYRLNLINPTGFDKHEEQRRAARHLEDEDTDAEETARPELDEQKEDPFEDLERGVPAFVRPEEDAVWMWEGHDWWNEQTGERLTGFDPRGSGDSAESNA
mgnify:FL=1|jgi:hypothetical protein